jgi:hypothetical protein
MKLEMPRVTIPMVALVLAVCGCEPKGGSEQGDSDTGTSTGTSTETGTETGTGTETDTETGTEDGCGDGIVDPGESCDEGPLNGSLGHCDLTCEGLHPIHVDIDAPPGGDGSSWAMARNDLRATVEELADTGGTVWVAEGTYTPPNAATVVRVGPGVSLYGGFAGVETLLSERDHLAHPTILQQTQPETPAVEIRDFTVETAPIVLDGFVITSNANVGTKQRGHGISVLGNLEDQVPEPQIYLHNIEIYGMTGALWVPGWSTVEIHNASIHDNVADYGAAIWQEHSRLYIHDSKIFANETNELGAIAHHYDPEFSYFGHVELWNSEITDNFGNGIDGATVILHDCLVQANSGGGARATLGLTAEDSDFIGNKTGAIKAGYGTILRSRFIENEGQFGGALFTLGSVTVTDSLFSNNVATWGGAIAGWMQEFGGVGAEITVSGSKFIGNVAERGGAIYGFADQFSGPASIDVINSQFVLNEAELGGAIYGPVRVQASSFAGNLAQIGGALAGLSGEVDFPGELHSCVLWPDDVSVNVTHKISNSCIPASVQGFEDLGGNAQLLADPFVHADLDDDGIEELYLDPGSDCVDLLGPARRRGSSRAAAGRRRV